MKPCFSQLVVPQKKSSVHVIRGRTDVRLQFPNVPVEILVWIHGG
jgi:hypothetical protein